MDSEQKKAHLKAVVDALPKKYQKTASLSYGGGELVVNGNITIGFTDDSYYSGGTTKIKADPGWSLKDCLSFKPRYWKRRQRDGKFAYEAVAKFITRVLDDYHALLDRRKKGDSIAVRRIAKLQEVFKKDPQLNALDLKIEAETTRNTESGSVDVSMGSYHHGAELKYNGKTFTGKISVMDLSAEQLAAMMMVMNLDRLNILDLLARSGDSILGPSIRRLTEEMDSDDSEEAAV